MVFGCASNDGSDVEAPLPPGSEEALALVKLFDAKVLDVARRSSELGQQGREAELRPLALASMDVPGIARASLGRLFDDLEPAQQQLWVETYTEFHIVAMAFNWRSARGARIEYIGETLAPRGTVMVNTRFDRAGQGSYMRRDYRVRNTPNGWRIIDIFSPANVSNVGMRRAEYLAVLTRTDFDGLIADMQRRIATRRSE